MGIHNPLPSSMRSECAKTGRILASFVKPELLGADKVIPPSVLANAKGLAIMTVFKAGFLGSGRFGSGVVVARLPDGRWSFPSAIGTVGGGFGGQIGFELTDFVFILNDSQAVKTFAQVGSITLGGNVSIAAGPVGRNAEAAGAASHRSVAGIFAYSRTKGLFAGVSLEGSVLIERRDANEKLYGRRATAKELLSTAPRTAEERAPSKALYRVLTSRSFSAGGAPVGGADDMYNDVPVYDDAHEDVVWQGRTGTAYGEGVQRDRTGSMGQGYGRANDDEYSFNNPSRASTWQDDPYDRASSRFGSGRADPGQTFDRLEQNRGRSSTLGDQSDYVYSDRKGPAPGRPNAPKPAFSGSGAGFGGAGFPNEKAKPAGPGQAVAKFTFEADQPGDLGFKKGDIITIVKRTESVNDWWTGRLGGREGIFPSNYVEVV